MTHSVRQPSAALLDRIVGPYLKGVTGPPTDLHAIAATIGITSVLSGDIEGLDGITRLVDGGREVLYAADQSSTRQRFTLAHEIAHAIVRRERELRRFRAGALERVCDRLAAVLVLPTDSLRAVVAERPDARVLRSAAARFDTSLVATAIRVAETTSTAAFEIADGTRLIWRRGVPATAIRTLIRSLGPLTHDGRLDDRLDLGPDLRECRIQVVPLPGRRALWLVMPLSVVERTSQPSLLTGLSGHG